MIERQIIGLFFITHAIGMVLDVAVIQALAFIILLTRYVYLLIEEKL